MLMVARRELYAAKVGCFVDDAPNLSLNVERRTWFVARGCVCGSVWCGVGAMTSLACGGFPSQALFS